MKSKFTSTCPACNSEIRQGKEIAKNNDGRWVHKHCCDELAELP